MKTNFSVKKKKKGRLEIGNWHQNEADSIYKYRVRSGGATLPSAGP